MKIRITSTSVNRTDENEFNNKSIVKVADAEDVNLNTNDCLKLNVDVNTRLTSVNGTYYCNLAADKKSIYLTKTNPGYVYDPSLDGGSSTTPAYTVALSSDKDTYTKGDTVTIAVKVKADKADTALACGQIEFNYDKSKLRFNNSNANISTSSAAITCVTANTQAVGKATFYGSSGTVGTDYTTIATYTFEAIADGSAAFSITKSLLGQTGSSESVTPAITAAVDAASLASITIEKPAALTISSEKFGGNYYLVKYVADSTVTSGSVYKHGENIMYHMSGYDSEGQYVYAYLTTVSALDATTPVTVSESASASAYVIDKAATSCDINGDTSTDIIDAQIAYDMIATYLSTTTGLDMGKWLKGDVNCDGHIDAGDARAIQYFIHHGTFTVPAAA